MTLTLFISIILYTKKKLSEHILTCLYIYFIYYVCIDMLGLEIIKNDTEVHNLMVSVV